MPRVEHNFIAKSGLGKTHLGSPPTREDVAGSRPRRARNKHPHAMTRRSPPVTINEPVSATEPEVEEDEKTPLGDFIDWDHIEEMFDEGKFEIVGDFWDEVRRQFELAGEEWIGDTHQREAVRAGLWPEYQQKSRDLPRVQKLAPVIRLAPDRRTKLSDETVIEIRQAYVEAERKYGMVRGLAASYGVHEETIRGIVKGKVRQNVIEMKEAM